MLPSPAAPVNQRKHFSILRGFHLADFFTLANAACGVSRLARYNVTAESLAQGGDKVAYFEGTPIPTSVLLTAVLAVLAWQDRLGENLYWGVWALGPWDLHPLALLFLLSGTLMISKTLRIPKF